MVGGAIISGAGGIPGGAIGAPAPRAPAASGDPRAGTSFGVDTFFLTAGLLLLNLREALEAGLAPPLATLDSIGLDDFSIAPPAAFFFTPPPDFLTSILAVLSSFLIRALSSFSSSWTLPPSAFLANLLFFAALPPAFIADFGFSITPPAAFFTRPPVL